MIKRVATGVGGSINVMGPGDGFWTVGPILKAVESKLFLRKSSQYNNLITILTRLRIKAGKIRWPVRTVRR